MKKKLYQTIQKEITSWSRNMLRNKLWLFISMLGLWTSHSLADSNTGALVYDDNTGSVCHVHDLLGVRVVWRPEAVDAEPAQHGEVPRDERKVQALSTNLWRLWNCG